MNVEEGGDGVMKGFDALGEEDRMGTAIVGDEIEDGLAYWDTISKGGVSSFGSAVEVAWLVRPETEWRQ